MRLDLDLYLQRRSPIHAWEPRCKLIGFMVLIFAFAFVQQLELLPAMLLVTASLYGLSRLPLSFLSQRLRYPGLFLLGIVGVLPFVSGQTALWQWEMLTIYQEGSLSVLLIATRFFSILTIALILVGTTPFLSLLKALRSLGLSPILTDMTLLTYRYLYDVMDNLATMQTAMRLRGVSHQWLEPGWRGVWSRLKHLVSLAGTLLVRSYEQSERIYKAMRLRGYGVVDAVGMANRGSGDRIPLNHFVALGGVVLLAMGFVLAEVLLHRGLAVHGG